MHSSAIHLRPTVRHSNDAYFVPDDQANILDVNEAACHVPGYQRAAAMGATVTVNSKRSMGTEVKALWRVQGAIE